MPKTMIDDLYPSMPWDEIDTVVFDVGNVLLRYVPDEILQELLPDEPHMYPLLKERIFSNPYWGMIDRGALTIAEAAEAMAGKDPALLPYTRKIMFGWWHLKAMPEGVAALHKCKAMGKKLYVLSNYNAEAFATALKDNEFFQLFDGIVVSSEEKLVKPDPAIYHLVTERYHLDPARTMFIDDNSPNIEGCMAYGWHGFFFNKPGKLATFLKAE